MTNIFLFNLNFYYILTKKTNIGFFNLDKFNLILELQNISLILFITGLGIILFNRLNLIIALMGIELILLSCNVNFAVSFLLSYSFESQIYILATLAISAIETAVGVSILILCYSVNKTTKFVSLNTLRR